MQVVLAEVEEENEFEGGSEGRDHAGLDGEAHDTGEELVGGTLSGGSLLELYANTRLNRVG